MTTKQVLSRKIHAPVLTGTQPVRALLFTPENAAEIAQFWCVGASLHYLNHECCHGYLLRLPRPQNLAVGALPAQALVEMSPTLAGRSRSLWACIPTSAALADLQFAAAALVLAQGGELVAFSHEDLRAVTIAECAELDAYYWVNPPATNASAATAVQAQLRVVPKVDARALLTGNAQNPEAQKFLDRLRSGGAAQAEPSLLQSFVGVGKLLAGVLSGAAKGQSDPSAVSAQATKPTVWQRLALLMKAQQLMGWQHAQFLQRMLQDLESGNWSEALKRAIPLGDLGRAGPNLPTQPWLSARQGLNWTHQSGGSVGVSGEVQSLLQQQYRQAFAALDREGRIEEAAFVLIELLRETEAGIDYLLKHGQAHKAAELAQARELAPAKVVRLWLCAGEPERALHVARLTQSHEQALALLRDRPELVKQFRSDWAQALLANHDYAKAVRVLWHLPEERHRAAIWLETAKAYDPALLPELLALQLALMPEQFQSYQAELQILLSARGSVACLRRESFAQSLLSYLPEARVSLVGVALMRALAQDYASGRASYNGGLLKRLERAANDPLWNADRSKAEPVTQYVPFLDRSDCMVLDAQVDTQVGLRIFQAHALNEGRYLLALGHSGVALVNRSGRTLAHFTQPATQLIPSSVASESATLWVTLQARLQPRVDSAPLVELGRLDLSKQRAKSWCITALSCSAQRAENGLWPVALARSLMLIDIHKPGFEAVWHVSDLPAEVRSVRLQATNLNLLLGGFEVPSQHWRYRWPEMALGQRADLPSQSDPHLLGDSIFQVQRLEKQLRVLRQHLPDQSFASVEWANDVEVISRKLWLGLIWSETLGLTNSRYLVQLYSTRPSQIDRQAAPLLEWRIESNVAPRLDGDDVHIYLSHGSQLTHIELVSGRISRLRAGV